MSYWIGAQSNELEDSRQNQKKLQSRLKTTMERQTNYKPNNAQQNEQNEKKKYHWQNVNLSFMYMREYDGRMLKWQQLH